MVKCMTAAHTRSAKIVWNIGSPGSSRYRGKRPATEETINDEYKEVDVFEPLAHEYLTQFNNLKLASQGDFKNWLIWIIDIL